MNNREKLIAIMVENQLDRNEISQYLKVKRQQLDHWLLPREARHYENIPDMALELLSLKLKYAALVKKISANKNYNPKE